MKLSIGHLGFDDTSEFFEAMGEVYRAPKSAPLFNGFRSGHRWECTKVQWDRYRATVFPHVKSAIEGRPA